MIEFISERIEFLWIIPIVAFAFFIFIVQLLSQKKEVKHDLSHEVVQFNLGAHFNTQSNSEERAADRLTQLEKAIASVTESISAQQRLIEQFHRDNTGYTEEINELKNKLRELYKEYDIILSENYSLRAKLKKLQEKRQETDEKTERPEHPPSTSSLSKPFVSQIPAKVDMKLYDDTRTFNAALLEDTSEIDISDLLNRSDLQ